MTGIIMNEYEKILSQARKNLESQKYKEAVENYNQAMELTKDNESKAVIWAELSWALYQSNISSSNASAMFSGLWGFVSWQRIMKQKQPNIYKNLWR